MKKILTVAATLVASISLNAQVKFACDGKELDFSSYQLVEVVEDFFVNRIYMKDEATEVKVLRLREREGKPHSYEVFALPKSYFEGKKADSYLTLTVVDGVVYAADIEMEPETKVIKHDTHTCGDDYWLEDELWTSMQVSFNTKEAAMKILDALQLK